MFRSKFGPAKRAYAALAGIIVVLLTVMAWSINDSSKAIRRQAETEERNVVLAIQGDLDRTIETLDLMLQAAVQGMTIPGVATMDPTVRQAVLFDTGSVSSRFGQTFITDETGRILYSSRGDPPKLSFFDRAFFQRHRMEDHVGLLMDVPVQSLVDGRWILPFSRRINHPDGSFAGVVTMALNIDFVQEMCAQFSIGEHGIIMIVSTAGRLVVHRPPVTAKPDRDMSNITVIARLKSGPSGVVESVAKIDGVHRLYTYSLIKKAPLLVTVGFSTIEIYEEWTFKSIITCVILVLLAVAGFILVYALWLEYGRRSRAEAIAHDSETRQQQLIENVVDHAIYFLDPNGIVASWNPGAQKIKGYTADEIVGQSFTKFFTLSDRKASEPERSLAVARECGRFEGSAWRVRKDGSLFWARIALTALKDENGSLLGFAKTAHDLTGRQVEEAQRVIMIEAAPTGMLVVNEYGTITLANTQAENIFGYPGGALLGQPIDILVPEAKRANHMRLRAAFAEGKNAGMLSERQIMGRRYDGGEVPLEIMLRPVQTQTGSIVVVSVFDTTERLRLVAERELVESKERTVIAETNARLEVLTRHLAKSRDQARHANEAKSRFLTAVTHELRTPLNGILGYAQLLDLEGGLSVTQVERVRAMQNAGEHLLGMINAVLDLSQIESDRIEMNAVPTDLASLAQSSVMLVSPAAQIKGLGLSLVVDPAVPTSLIVDPTRLRQVLVNLLGNAVKFTLSGSVELRLLPGRAGPDVRIEVADTGPGVDPNQSHKLFMEFERLDVGTFKAVEGAGLGLAITARLVNRMGGRVGYEPNPTGGSIFWTELPIADARGADDTIPAPPPAGELQEAKWRILVVDDVAMNRDIAAAFLRLAGHQVVCVGSGKQALETMEMDHFDAVLMDVRMPGMDGLEATRRIRRLPGEGSAVPILALTAQAFKEQIQKCSEAGMDGHVAKPMQSQALLSAIANVIAARKHCAIVPQLGTASDEVPEFPILDEDTFHATAPLLQPPDLLKHLKTLIARCESLVAALRAPNMGAGLASTVEAAHALGGAASTFGFVSLGVATRKFEQATGSDESEITEVAESLIDATEASIEVLRKLTNEMHRVE